MYTCPNAHSFQVSCNAMRLTYQSQVKLLDGPTPDFNSVMDSGSRMEKFNYNILGDLRKKFTANTKHLVNSPMAYKKV